MIPYYCIQNSIPGRYMYMYPAIKIPASRCTAIVRQVRHAARYIYSFPWELFSLIPQYELKKIFSLGIRCLK